METSGSEWVRSRVEAALAARIASAGDADADAELAWDAVQDADLSSSADRMAEVARRLGLDAGTVDVLWVVAAPEIDARFGVVFGFLLGDATRRLPTPRMIASLLATGETEPGRVLGCLAVDAPLRRRGCLRLLEREPGVSLADQPVGLARELAAFLLATSLHQEPDDPRLHRRDPVAHPLGRGRTLARLRAALNAPTRAPVLASGPDAADLLAVAAERGLVVVDARAAVHDAELRSRGALIAALEDRALVLDVNDMLGAEDIAALQAVIDAGGECTLLCSAVPERLAGQTGIAVEVPMPTLADRRDAWTALAGATATQEVAAKFRLSTAQIAKAARIAQAEAEIAGRASPDPGDLDAGARQASRSALAARAVRLAPDRRWEDLVVSERQLEQLRSIAAYLRHRDQVLTEWGFERAASGRLGLAVLFAGESGTGKTMAARALAADLGLELYAVNLATVVSKFVGETEQNLERIFAAAEGSNAILLFDEADALFGRRSDVSASSDRYANIEVAYLLQRMEAHTGAVILTTNLKQNVDTAFLRRLDFVVDFRFPEPNDRRRLWSLVIPADTPLADDVDLDFLADRFKLSGGSIRNCSLGAAFEAAAAGQPIRMAHIVRAIASEYGKLGRLTVESDFEPYFAMLRDPDAEPAREESPEPAPDARASERVRIGSRIEEL